jgi:hypothetical protein
MKKIIITCALFPLALWGQGSSTGSSQLLLPFHARTAALAGAVVGSRAFFSASLQNPAALSADGSIELLLSHSEWLQDVQSEFMAARLPFSIGTVGIALTNVNVKGIELRQRPGPADGSFTARFASFHLSYAGDLGDAITVGVTAKYLYEKLFVDEASGYAFDFGVLYQTPFPHLSLGASWMNSGRMKAFQRVRARLPQQLQIGLVYKSVQGDFTIAPSLDAVTASLTGTSIAAGVEVSYQNTICLRLGYNASHPLRSFSVGGGIQYEFLKFDYAFVPFSLNFGNAHLLSLGFEL